MIRWRHQAGIPAGRSCCFSLIISTALECIIHERVRRLGRQWVCSASWLDVQLHHLWQVQAPRKVPPTWPRLAMSQRKGA
jgi:hypothetical protein